MLSIRLKAIAHLVNKDSVIADIGSDHGLLPCFLAKEGWVNKAYAIDNKEGPLKFAYDNIKAYNLENSVYPILADGLENLSSDVTSIVIAGMGFVTIETILTSNLDKVLKVNQVIIQSNTEVSSLRKWIMDHKFLIEDEVIVRDNDKIYTIISFNPLITKDYAGQSHYLSALLLNKKNELYLESLNERVGKLAEIIKFRSESDLIEEFTTLSKVLK